MATAPRAENSVRNAVKLKPPTPLPRVRGRGGEDSALPEYGGEGSKTPSLRHLHEIARIDLLSGRRSAAPGRKTCPAVSPPRTRVCRRPRSTPPENPRFSGPCPR